MTPGRRRLVALAIVVGLAGAAVAHVDYWYLPRARCAVPVPNGLPARLLADERFDVRLWVPFPHQNLARATAGIDDAEAVLAAAARLAELPPSSLPSFGPFRMPPARELALAYRRSDGAAVVAARLYPSMALLGRLAGLVAGNPWLRGGEVSLGGRSVRVRWQGLVWLLESELGEAWQAAPGIPAAGDAGRASAGREAFARLTLAAPHGVLPAGAYALRSGPRRGLVLGSFAGSPAAPPPGDEEAPARPGGLSEETFLLAVRATGESEGGGSALLLLRSGQIERGELPSAAVVYTGTGRRFELPAENLAGLLDLDLHRTPVGEGAELLALDRRARDEAMRAGATLEPLLATKGSLLALWLDPAPLAAYARVLRITLESVPLLPKREAGFWHDVETVTAPLSGVERIVLVVKGDRLVLWAWPIGGIR